MCNIQLLFSVTLLFSNREISVECDVNYVAMQCIVITINFHMPFHETKLSKPNFSQMCISYWVLFHVLYAHVVNQYCAEGHQKCNRILNEISASCSFAADIPSLRQLSFPRGIAEYRRWNYQWYRAQINRKIFEIPY